MKPVYNKKIISNYYIYLRSILTILIYLFLSFLYLSLNILIQYNIIGFFNFSYLINKGIYIFFLFVSPLILSLNHILYKEKNWLFCKAILWICLLFIAFSQPIIIIGFGI
ncbi:MAG: hypothetical protein GY679_05100 [Mycoplasma sp.]|nr:hypothetical protein [Mycoplasma sp.]